MDYLDPQKSMVAWLVLLGGIAGVCWLLWLLNDLLKRFGVTEYRVDRLGSSMLEMERLFRPSAEHVLTVRRQRKATLPSGKDEPPEPANANTDHSDE